MIKTNKVLDTAGDGLWSDVMCGVLVTDVSLDLGESAEYPRNELVVGFDPETWNTLVDGLIYTDSKFLRGVRKLLNDRGLPGRGVSYSGVVGYHIPSRACRDQITFPLMLPTRLSAPGMPNFPTECVRTPRIWYNRSIFKPRKK